MKSESLVDTWSILWVADGSEGESRWCARGQVSSLQNTFRPQPDSVWRWRDVGFYTSVLLVKVQCQPNRDFLALGSLRAINYSWTSVWPNEWISPSDVIFEIQQEFNTVCATEPAIRTAINRSVLWVVRNNWGARKSLDSHTTWWLITVCASSAKFPRLSGSDLQVRDWIYPTQAA